MSNEDQYPQGGSLSDMATSGTTVPSDSAKPRYIPSKAKPGQGIDSSADIGSTDLASAADNMDDMPRSTRDNAAVPEAVTGTGDALPSEIGSKNLHHLGNPNLSKGDASYDKHVRQKGSDQEQGAVPIEQEQEVKDGVAQ